MCDFYAKVLLNKIMFLYLRESYTNKNNCRFRHYCTNGVILVSFFNLAILKEFCKFVVITLGDNMALLQMEAFVYGGIAADLLLCPFDMTYYDCAYTSKLSFPTIAQMKDGL